MIWGDSPLKLHCEGAKKQVGDYTENVSCFSRNFVKILQGSYFNKLFLLVQSKNQFSTHPVVFFNLLMLLVTSGHTYLNLEVLVEGLPECVHHHLLFGEKVFWKILRNNQTKWEASCQLCSLEKLFWKLSGNS